MPVTAALVTAGAGVVQSILGGISQGKANKQLKKLFKQRTPFSTPSEVFDIMNASQFQAGQGYGGQTLDYLTGQADRAFATNTGTALRLGADPNVIAGLDDQYLQSIMNIGNNDALLQLQNFDKFLNAKQLVAANKEAEWQSKEDILKDQMQSYGLNAQAGANNVNSGFNAIVQAGTNLAIADLYADRNKTTVQNYNGNPQLPSNLPPPVSNGSLGGGGLTPSQMQQIQQIINNP